MGLVCSTITASSVGAASLSLADCATDVAGRTFDVAQGNVLTVSFSSPCAWGYGAGQYKGLASSIGVIGNDVWARDASNTAIALVEREPMATGQVTLVVTPDPSVTTTTTSVNTTYFWIQTGDLYQAFTVRVLIATPPSPAEPTAGPANVLQQVPTPDGRCGQVARPDLDWSGVDSGGWGPSWASWANSGAGGSVCTRTLSFTGSGWSVLETS